MILGESQSLVGGGRIWPMDKDSFPLDRGVVPERILVPLRLKRPDHEKLLLLVEIFNEIHKTLRRQGRKWSPTSAVEQIVTDGLEEFFARYGGFPATPEKALDVKRRAVAEQVKRATSKK